MRIRIATGLLVLVAAALLATACRPGAEPAAPEQPKLDALLAQLPSSEQPPPDEAVRRAKAAARRLGVELKSELLRLLDESGPVGAIEVCSKRATEIRQALAEEGLMVRRVSLKVRNPADRPDDWERRILETLVEIAAVDRSALPEELAVVVARDDGEELRYLRPIFVQRPCLTCHGPVDRMDPEVRDKIAELYPGDQATGYAEGDLRGAISVRLDLGQR
ncbi:MAG: DUF3365 domain-containing protein [Acidobacteria bacterium]|nr:MAG: DUF3365 domain-containing protein [Acidobacteriota bacterium]